MKAFEAELLALNSIVKQAAGVATPVGFSVETWGNLSGARTPAHAPGYPRPRLLPMAGGFTFGAFPICEYERNGKTVRSDTGETALRPFRVSEINAAVFDSRHVEEWSPIDHDAFLKPVVGTDIAVVGGGEAVVGSSDGEGSGGASTSDKGKAAGMRTHMLVALGAALFVLIPQQAGASIADLTRVLQGLVAGVGFLGAGAIVMGRRQEEARGVTTAAGVWLTAAIGVSAGMGREATAVLSTFLALVILYLIPKVEQLFKGREGPKED